MIPFDHDWRGLDAAEVDGHQSLRRRKWEDIFPVYGGSVALSRPFAQKYDLPLGASVNDDPSRMHYLMAGYHQLHCLKVVRETIYQLNGTSSDTEPVLWDHVLHCMEAVRQALFCFMDDTLVLLALEWPGIPNGQQHVCRNSNAIRKWAEANEHELPPNPHGPPAHNHSTKT